MTGENSPMEALSTYMANAKDRALPAEVVEKCRLHILDTLAAIISGAHLLPGQKALDFAKTQSGNPEAAVLGTNLRIGTAMAAMTNGMLAHADETDDSHSTSRSHPGCCSVPAALAMAELHGASGEALMRAVALGYDVGTRAVRSLDAHKVYEAGHASHAFAGGFGAAAAAGCIAGFDARRMRWLLSYAAQQTAGITSWRGDKDHIEKAFVFAGMPARNGVYAALMVAAGFTGVEDVFSGKRNYFVSLGQDPNPSILTEGLGETYALMETTIKKWSVGSPSQPVLDMALDLLKKENFTADDIASLKLRMSTRESVAHEKGLADVSVRHLLAMMLIDRTVTFASTHDVNRMKDPALAALQERMDIASDPSILHRKPTLDIILKDGRALSRKAEEVRGTPKNPMTQAEVIEKATGLIEPELGTAQTRRLIDTIWHLDDNMPVSTLIEKLAPARFNV